MHQLVAIAYHDLATAERVRDELVAASEEGLAELEDAVVVERRDDGKIKLHQLHSTGRSGAAWGALGGAAIGMLFLAPLLGAAIGAATGGLGGSMSDDGIADTFLEDLGARLKPGAAAVIVLGSTDARDQLIARVQQFGGEVVQTSLDFDAEQALRAALSSKGA